MSHGRCACVTHQSQLFKNDAFKNIRESKHIETVDTTQKFINNKISHANLLYFRWKSHFKKHIFSRRLVISFTETLHARDGTSILKRIFNKSRHIRHDKPAEQLATAQKYQFLFLKSHINKSVKYLKYAKGFTLPEAKYYKLLVPFFAKPDSLQPLTTSEKDLENGLHICTNWKKSLPRERILSPAEQKKLRCEQRQREEIIQQEKAEADYHGTTVTKVDRWLNEKNYLTSKTNTFHNEMTERSQHYINAKDVEHQRQIQKEMYQFIKGFDFTRRSKQVGRLAPLRKGASQDTSDDTKEVEHRPNKRDAARGLVQNPECQNPENPEPGSIMLNAGQFFGISYHSGF
ncbi:unnamed protein product [Rhizophagus irregularis]|nr:unnamed protein product [Rhizophagus irregularis]